MKKKISYMLICMMVVILLTGCGNSLDKTTVFFSMIVSPDSNYIRLEKDGDFYVSTGLKGKYEVKDNTVTLNDEQGSSSTGYLIKDGQYFIYESYSAYEEKIPESDRFEIICFDGQRTSLTFHADGTMEKDIYESNYIDYHVTGSYERKGELIICSINNKENQELKQTYAVKDGILYECYSSLQSDFDNETVQKIINHDYGDDDLNVMAVVIIIGLVIVIFTILCVFIYKVNSRNNKAKRKKRK